MICNECKYFEWYSDHDNVNVGYCHKFNLNINQAIVFDYCSLGEYKNDKQAVTNKEAIRVLEKYMFLNKDDDVYTEAIDIAIKALENEHKKGKWIDHSDETILFGGVTYTPPFTCSECGKTALNEPWWYCPNCGADMREADNE